LPERVGAVIPANAVVIRYLRREVRRAVRRPVRRATLRDPNMWFLLVVEKHRSS